MNHPIILHPVNRDHPRANRYCGPAAISILTGFNTHDAALLIRRVTGKKMVKGLSGYHLSSTLNSLGFQVHHVFDLGMKTKPTFARWCSDARRDSSKTYLVIAGNHWVVVQGDRCCCGIMKTITPVSLAPKQRARVTWVYEVVLKDPSKIQIPTIELKARAQDPEAKIRREARKIAERNGITIEAEHFGGDKKWYVYGPEWLEDDEDLNPFHGDHYCYDWGEVYNRVKDLAEVITELESKAANPS